MVGKPDQGGDLVGAYQYTNQTKTEDNGGHARDPFYHRLRDGFPREQVERKC